MHMFKGEIIEIGDFIRYEGYHHKDWCTVIELFDLGVYTINGWGRHDYIEYENITEHRKGGNDTALTIPELNNRKIRLEEKLMRTDVDTDLYEELKADLEKTKRMIDEASPSDKGLMEEKPFTEQETADMLQKWKQKAKTDNDPVNNPAHYTSHPSGIECIEITEHMGCCLANAIKYIWRADLKGNAIRDLEKAAYYVNREISRRKRMSK